MGTRTGAVVPGVGPLAVIVPRVWFEVVILGVEIPGVGPLAVIVLVVRLLVITGGVTRTGVLGAPAAY